MSYTTGDHIITGIHFQWKIVLFLNGYQTILIFVRSIQVPLKVILLICFYVDNTVMHNGAFTLSDNTSGNIRDINGQNDFLALICQYRAYNIVYLQ